MKPSGTGLSDGVQGMSESSVEEGKSRVTFIDASDTRACGKCRFWVASTAPAQGSCHRGPPLDVGWPETHATASCGWFRPEREAETVVRRPRREVSANFIERWPQLGWNKGDGAEEEWGAHSRTIQRWLDECGRDQMVLARKRYRDAQRLIEGRVRRKRYVMGRTLTPPLHSASVAPADDE